MKLARVSPPPHFRSLSAFTPRIAVLIAVVLFAESAHAEDTRSPKRPGSYSAQMATCEAVATAPFVLETAFFGGRVIVDIAWHWPQATAPIFRNDVEGDVYGSSAILLAGGYVGCGPALHLAHARPLEASLSLTMRVALPAAAVLATYELDKATETPGDHVGNGLGAALFGAVAVPASIAGALYVDHEILSAPSDNKKTSAMIAPSVTPMRGGAVAAVGGTF